MRFEPMELTGVFEGELVHAVPPDDPQVAVEISWLTDSGQRLTVDEVDPTIPAPVAPATTRRVRLVAKPNWASIGFEVSWTVPDSVQVEDPNKLTSPDLGWVVVPPGARQLHDRRDRSSGRSRQGQSHGDCSIAADGSDDARIRRRHVCKRRGASWRGTSSASVRATHTRSADDRPLGHEGGTGDVLNASIALPAGWQSAEPQQRTENRPANTHDAFPRVSWVLTIGPDAPIEGSIVVSSGVGADAVERRLRYQVLPALASGTPALDLLPYVDWRSDPGQAPALAFATRWLVLRRTHMEARANCRRRGDPYKRHARSSVLRRLSRLAGRN